MIRKRILFIVALFFFQCSSRQDHTHSRDDGHDRSGNHSGVSHAMQDDDKRYFDYQSIRRAAEDSTRNFNPAFVRSFHSARVYAIRDYQIFDSLVTLREQAMPVIRQVAGELPSPVSTGNFSVTILDAKENVLYRYLMESPLYVRREHGLDKGLYKIKAGSFLVPLPQFKDASKILLEDNDGTKLVSSFK